METLEEHKVNADEAIEVLALDEPGAGGAHHHYRVTGYSKPPKQPGDPSRVQQLDVFFQDGPIKENGTNGVTQEVLLSIVQHRLRCFQEGDFACAENAEALEHVTAALATLKRRTERRLAQGVEGTNEKDPEGDPDPETDGDPDPEGGVADPSGGES